MHLALLVSEETFDEVSGRLQERGLPYWADPMRSRPQQFSADYGGEAPTGTAPTATTSRS